MTDCAATPDSCSTTGVCRTSLIGATPPNISRRTFTVAAGATAVGLLAACSSADDAGADTGIPDATPGATLATVALDDVPVGGGVIIADVPLVVTRPTDTEVRAFSGICTHQGCAVGQITDRGIVCPCHTSIFALDTGDVVGGPAPEPLPELDATVNGTEIVVTVPAA